MVVNIELLNTSPKPTAIEAKMRPNITSQIPFGAPGYAYQSKPIPITNKSDHKPIHLFLLPLKSDIDPSIGLRIAIAMPEMVWVKVNFCAPSAPVIKTSVK